MNAPSRIKKKTDSWIVKSTYRKISEPAAILLSKTCITPNMVSFLSIISSAIAGFFFSLGSWPDLVKGYIFLQLVVLLDAVDGSLARYTGIKGTYGSWVDKISNKLHKFFFVLGVTVGIYKNTGNSWYLILGYIANFLWFFSAYISETRSLRFAFKEDITIFKEEKSKMLISFTLLVTNIFGLLILFNQPVLALWFVSLISLNAFRQIFSIRKQWYKEHKI